MPWVSFRIIGTVILAYHCWRDRARVRTGKKNTYYHPPLMCICALGMLEKDKQYERSFSPTLQIKIKDGQIVQLPDEVMENLMLTGVRLTSVLCGDIAMKPSLPTSLGNFNISKMFFNGKFCYILSGRKIRWNYLLNPLFHIIRQLIGE